MADRLHVAKLDQHHDVGTFDCGSGPLNTFLQRYAYANQRAGASQTYVAVSGAGVIGYHTLVVGEVAYDGVPERLVRGLARHPVPVVVLARLAVDRSQQRRGIGAALVADAMRRVLQAAEIAGVRAMIVHAKDSGAQRFYEHLGFMPFLDKPLMLYRLLKDIRAMRGE